jgi:curved DNA-binding protein CbpA
MVLDYYSLLDLKVGSSDDEIKRAYRKKAREFHPDLNHSGTAMDMFIRVTEAYEFLMSHSGSRNPDKESYNSVVEEWNSHQRDMARKRAKAYARSSYIKFKNTRFYKTTRIFDGTTIIFSLIIAIGIIFFSIYGFLWRKHHALSSEDKPSVASFILLLSLGGLFLTVSLGFLSEYLMSSKWYKTKYNGKAEKNS